MFLRWQGHSQGSPPECWCKENCLDVSQCANIRFGFLVRKELRRRLSFVTTLSIVTFVDLVSLQIVLIRGFELKIFYLMIIYIIDLSLFWLLSEIYRNMKNISALTGNLQQPFLLLSRESKKVKNTINFVVRYLLHLESAALPARNKCETWNYVSTLQNLTPSALSKVNMREFYIFCKT